MSPGVLTLLCPRAYYIFLKAGSPEIVAWLSRRADGLNGLKHKAVATDEL